MTLWPLIPVFFALMLSGKAFGRSPSGSIPSGGAKRSGRAEASAQRQRRAEAARLAEKKKKKRSSSPELPDPLKDIMDHAMPPAPVAQHEPPPVPSTKTKKKKTPPAPLPAAKRSPKEAAIALLAYVDPITKAKQSSILGSKGKPNTIVARAQTDMGEIPVDGIYGPATRARGKVLIGKSFPPR